VPKSETTIRAIVLNGFLEYCRSQRVDGDALFKAVGLDPTAKFELEETIGLNVFAHLLHNAAGAAKDPCFGLSFANSYPVGGTGLVGPMLVHASTVREALVAFTRYIALIVNPIAITYEEDETGHAAIEWSYQASFTAPRLQYISLTVALPIIRLRMASGENWFPASAEFEHDVLPCADQALAHFGNSIKYNRPRNRVVIPAAVLALPLKSADPRLLVTLQHYAAHDLEKSIAPANVAARVSKLVLENLAAGTVTLERTAEALNLTARSLQWQLSQAGTTFEKILNDARRNKAEPLLTGTGMPLGEIATAVGFSELSSFSRAASAWFGMSPRAYRQKFREANAAKSKSG
jgi:AraC-like DNA-binding protein